MPSVASVGSLLSASAAVGLGLWRRMPQLDVHEDAAAEAFGDGGGATLDARGDELRWFSTIYAELTPLIFSVEVCLVVAGLCDVCRRRCRRYGVAAECSHGPPTGSRPHDKAAKAAAIRDAASSGTVGVEAEKLTGMVEKIRAMAMNVLGINRPCSHEGSDFAMISTSASNDAMESELVTDDSLATNAASVAKEPGVGKPVEPHAHESLVSDAVAFVDSLVSDAAALVKEPGVPHPPEPLAHDDCGAGHNDSVGSDVVQPVTEPGISITLEPQVHDSLISDAAALVDSLVSDAVALVKEPGVPPPPEPQALDDSGASHPVEAEASVQELLRRWDGDDGETEEASREAALELFARFDPPGEGCLRGDHLRKLVDEAAHYVVEEVRRKRPPNVQALYSIDVVRKFVRSHLDPDEKGSCSREHFFKSLKAILDDVD